jgi:hypothetical protein
VINPVNAGLNVAFGVLTRGIDAKARRRQGDGGLTDEEAGLRRTLLSEIRARPGISLSDLESVVHGDPYREAVLPSRLAQAQYEGLVTADSPTSTDPRWSLTELGEAQLDAA